MVISFFKSVVDVSPILFVKVGQEQVGAIDFVITPANNPMIPASVNFYAIDPFNNPFAQGDESMEVDHSCPPWNPRNETNPDKMIK